MSKETLEGLLKEARNRILSLKDNWDDEGEKGFQVSTWDKVNNLLIELSPSELPDILPYTEGSIDIHWRFSKFDFLINVPEGDESISIYGINKNGEEIEGNIPPITLTEINKFIKRGFEIEQ